MQHEKKRRYRAILWATAPTSLQRPEVFLDDSPNARLYLQLVLIYRRAPTELPDQKVSKEADARQFIYR